MNVYDFSRLLIVCLLTGATAASAQDIIVSGRVTGAETGESLIGASVIVAEPETSIPIVGTVTDLDGRYTLEGIEPGTYDLIVRFVGFAEARLAVTLAEGEPYRYDISLGSGRVFLNTLVVTASRQEEKVLDAPASMSVLAHADRTPAQLELVALELREVEDVVDEA